MHEMAIASQIVEQSLRIAAEHGAGRILEVEIEVGAMRGVVPEALQMAFTVCSEGTAAEGARLHIATVAARARCKLCGREFEPQYGFFVCPACDRADVELLAGQDILLKGLECRSPQEADRP